VGVPTSSELIEGMAEVRSARFQNCCVPKCVWTSIVLAHRVPFDAGLRRLCSARLRVSVPDGILRPFYLIPAFLAASGSLRLRNIEALTRIVSLGLPRDLTKAGT
jgi:hypothetical protein